MDNRLYHCNMKAKEKRFQRAYKVRPSIYRKAMKRARKEKIPLASLVEDVITGYAQGMEEYLFIPKLNRFPISTEVRDKY